MHTVVFIPAAYQYQNAQEKENAVHMETHTLYFLYPTSIVVMCKQEILGYATMSILYK